MKRICYKTSKDYKRLKELLDKGFEVVCFITYDFNARNRGREDYKEMMTTDICYARFNDEGQYSNYSVGCRGTGYITYYLHGLDYQYSFEDLLEAQNIEFIEPTITF